jgi:hypothetical protein
MDSNKKTSYLLLVIGVLIMGLAGCIGYIAGNGGSTFGFSNNKFSSDEDVMREIEELKSMYDAKISQKTASFKALKDEKAKVAQLVFELEKTKADAAALLKYKTQFNNLESKMHVLVDEIVVLKSKKSSAIAIKNNVKSTIDNSKSNSLSIPISNNTKKVVTKSKTVVEKKITVPPKQDNTDANSNVITPVTKEIEVIKPEVEKFENVSVTNLKSFGYDVKTANTGNATLFASRTDIVKVQFTLEANPKAKAEEVKFYIQVIDSKNNVMGRRITEFFDDKSLTYSYSKTVFYNNLAMNVEQEIVAKGFEKGTYFVNIFDRNRLVARTEFTLK